MKKQDLMKKIGNGILFCLITILAFKFFAWNSWKLEWAADFMRGVINAPPAVNLTVTDSHGLHFKNSFSFNPTGNYYIINRFDISPYIRESSGLMFSIDKHHQQSPLIYRFKNFNIAAVGDRFFVFTKPDCGIDAFVELKDSAFSIVNSLARLTVDKEKKGTLFRSFPETPVELKYRNGRLSVPLPVPFLKGDTYEIVFDYRLEDTSPDATLFIRVFAAGKGNESVIVNHALETPPPEFGERYREACIVFSPGTGVPSPLLYVTVRSRFGWGAFAGRVYLKNITLYKYDRVFEGKTQLPRSTITYSDVLEKVKETFLEYIPVKTNAMVEK
jgi:hypothetical protein